MSAPSTDLTQEKQRFELLSQEFENSQKDYSKFIAARQQLEAQLQENKIVQDEFALLKSDAKIYKLTGPVLLPQDKAEATLNVDKRLEFIRGEIKRAETQIADCQKSLESKREELLTLRMKIQGV
ncbi:Prefoldin [Nadsonia fulvescens var. elongata DSM 6958]|uniref:Prefoldin n=1 Tax=Nadsonia fulvescens var. elongata DSM 6958 TaxID=857566 RepID=A0A1E3PHI0_9ASCO|nr:Prefoldin [Nadsonia fulvescens var. elongata DSM 6958]